MDKNSQVTILLTATEVKRINKLRKQLEANRAIDDLRNLVFSVTISSSSGIGDNVYVEANKIAINSKNELVLGKTDVTDYESW